VLTRSPTALRRAGGGPAVCPLDHAARADEPAADLHAAAGADQGQAHLMTVFQGAVDATFAEFGIDALYAPAGGDPLPVRVIARGSRGLCNRSSAARRVANRLPAPWLDMIVRLRCEYRMTCQEIAERLQLPRSTRASEVVSPRARPRRCTLGDLGLQLTRRHDLVGHRPHGLDARQGCDPSSINLIVTGATYLVDRWRSARLYRRLIIGTTCGFRPRLSECSSPWPRKSGWW
jgi:hypothetical protein